jgi:PAS domain S-box-containing protein
MDAAPVAVLATDEAGYYIYGNPAAEALLGYNPVQLREHHAADLHEADPQWFQAQFEQLQRLHSWSGRLVLRHANGSLLKVAVNVFGSRRRGHGVDYVCLSRPLPADALEIGRVVAPPEPHYALDSRDFSALQLMAEGFSDREIASVLGLRLPSLNRAIGSIFQKMNVTSRTQACIRALKGRLIL